MIAANTIGENIDGQPLAIAGGNYFAEGVYAKTDVRRGVTRNRAGARLVYLTSDFLTGFRRAILDECGPAADVVFKTCGRKWGGFLAKQFDRELSAFLGQAVRDLPMAKFQACLADLFSHHGWGLVKVDFQQHAQGLILVTIPMPIFAEIALRDQSPEGMVDSLTAGLMAGLFSELFGQDLDCFQTQCRACGAEASEFVVGLTTRLAGVPAWLDAGKTHRQVLTELATVRV